MCDTVVVRWARPDSRFASRHYTFTFHAQIPAIHAAFHVLNAAFSAPKRLKIVAKRLKSPEFCSPWPDRPRLVARQMILKKIRYIDPFRPRFWALARSKIASDFRIFSRPLAIHA